jgi:phage terminase large subunit-like protein
LFPGEADGALGVFRELKIVDAVGSPTMGQVCRPWIIEFVSSVFGAYNPVIGRRLITEFFLLISKKNSKSTTAAGIMLTALIRNWRRSAEFLILAPTVEIANNSFYPARDMVNENEELKELLHVQEHYKTITNRINGSFLKVVAADNETVGGKKATGVLVDELWLFGKQPNAESMLREATGGLASRPEGFTIYLSTQSDMPPAGVFRQKLQYARSVRDGKIKDKRFLPVLYEFPQEMVKDGKIPPKQHWHITNPNLGASVDPEYLEREHQKAEHDGAASLCGFLAKNLNIEIGLALQSDRWVGADYWERQGRPAFTLTELLASCEVVDVGIDGGGLDDLLGLAIIGRHKVTGAWWVWTHAWVHTKVLELRKSEAGRLRDLAAAGDLTIITEVGEDTEQVASIVRKVYDSGKLDRIGVDPSGLGTILDEIVAAGVPLKVQGADGKERDLISGISQGWKMYGAILTAERKLAEGVLVHCGQPMMAWCVGNAKIEPRGNAAIITKQASGRAKIDPLLAMLNAVTLMSLNPEAPGKIQVMFV